MRLVAFLLAASAACAQTTPPPSANAAISGVVRDRGTGQPLADFTVSTSVNVTLVNNTTVMSPNTRDVQSTTDAQGRYRLGDLPPGPYRISARAPGSRGFFSQVTRNVTLAGHDLENIDFNIIMDGVITGRVIDDNKEPVPSMSVFLVAREYYLGSVGYFFRATSITNDRGEFKLTAPAGRPYLLMTEKRAQKIPARSDVPLDPKLRRRVPMRTWFPNSPDREGAIAITLRPGEHRERVDIEVKKSPSYCAEGALEGLSGPAALSFDIQALQPSNGASSSGGMYVTLPGGTTAADGKFRICELYPGSFRLSVTDRNAQPIAYGSGVVTIVDRDLHNLKAVASPGYSLPGEVVWDGEPPSAPETPQIRVFLQPLLRTSMPGEKDSARVSIPGSFQFEGLLLDDFGIRLLVNSPGLYAKDVLYAGHSVMNDPLRFGGAPGEGIKVIIGRDGATLSARVTDKDGNPVPDIRVLILPGEIRSEAMLATALVSGQTDQLGMYTSHTLAPGKYYVAASEDGVDPTPESIGKLWRSRDRFKEVELSPKGTAQVSIQPVRIE
jgi:Carboxypeptidase regulatory-like domain